MKSHAKASTAGSTHRRAAARPALLSLATAALLALLVAPSAQAAQSYGNGTDLSTGALTSGVAVNQSSRDLYVASEGSATLGVGITGKFKRFDKEGNEIACTLTGTGLNHPAGVAIDPKTNNVYVTTAETGATNSKLHTFGQACGSELSSAFIAEAANAALIAQPATDSEGNIYFPNAPSGKLQKFQPNGTEFTAPEAPDFPIIGLSRPTAAALDSAGRIYVLEPRGVGKNEIQEVNFEGPWANGDIFKLNFNGTELGPITYNSSFTTRNNNIKAALQPFGEIGTNNVFVNGVGGTTNSLTFQGALATVNVPLMSCAVVSSAEGTCSVVQKQEPEAPTTGHLLEYAADGSSIGTLLSGELTTLAIDRSTGDLYLGVGYGGGSIFPGAHNFHVEKYTPGLTKLTEFGLGQFTSQVAASAFNQIALDETNGKVYVADGGPPGKVQVFTDTSAKKTLSTSTSGTGTGQVNCYAVACKAEYDEGDEVKAEGKAAKGSEFVKWSAATGAAAACLNTTSACTFTASANAALTAEFAAKPKHPINATVAGNGKVSASEGTIANCTSAGGSNCTGQYSEEQEPELSATGDPGNHFVGWNVTGATSTTCTGTTSPCKVTMGATNISVSAEFAQNGFNLKLLKAGDGKGAVTSSPAGINCGAACAEETALFGVSEVVTLEESTQEGSTFSGWGIGDCESEPELGKKCLVTMSAAKEVHATFTQNAPTVENNAPGAITKSSIVLKGHVNNNGAEAGSACKFQIALEESPGIAIAEPACSTNPVTGNSSTAVEATVSSGLSANTKYVYRVIATNTGGTSTGTPDQAAQTLPNAPAVTNDAPGTITQTSIVLKGHVDNEEAEAGSSCKFQIALESSPGTAIEEPTCSVNPVTGNSSTAVEATVSSGLSPNTKYVYRVVATNAGGTSTGAPDQQAKTLPEAPTVSTTEANPVSKTTATLKGEVNPHGGLITNCHFEYGPTGNPSEFSAPCATGPGEGNSPVAVSAEISGLSASTTYKFKLFATNSGGTGEGSQKEFTTTALSKPSVTNDPPGTITKESVQMKGHVNNNGIGGGSTCKFQIALESSPGTAIAEPSCDVNPVEGGANTEVKATASGLLPQTKYVYRVVATNSDGTSTGTPDQKAKTLPEAPTGETNPPGTITKSSIVLKGHIDNHGAEEGTSCKFYLATEAAPGTPIAEPACNVNPVTGTGSTAVEATVSSLSPNVKYVYRVLGSDSGGTATGSNQQAQTLPNAPTVSNDAPGTITKSSIVLKGHVNNNGAEAGSACKFQIALEESPGIAIAEPACSTNPVTGNTSTAVEATVSSGLSPNTKYVYRVIATNTGGTSTGTPDQAAQTLPNAPTVSNDAPGTITQTSIVLKAHVNNNGAEAGSACKFQIALESSPGTAIAEPACSTSPVTGNSSTAVEATVSTGLSANTKYVYRVIATNTGGTSTGAPDQAAQTLPNAPTVTNDAPGTITQTSVVMKGHVNDNGAEAGSSCKFQIALESSPGTAIAEPACSTNPVTGNTSTAVEATVSSGLSPNTKYVYRVIATNTGGTTTGTPDRALETISNPPTAENNAPGTITQTSIVLKGHVNNSGATAGSACKFQIALESSPGTAVAEPSCGTIAGNTNTSVEATASGLTANTKYVYRVIATNSGGSATGAPDQKAQTLPAKPTVENNVAGTITQTTIALRGHVNNNNAEAGSTCKFQIALEAVPATPVAEPACTTTPVTGNTSTAVEATASSLNPNTKYVYRVIATNSGGTSTGTPDQKAQTLPNPPTVTTTAGATGISQTVATIAGTVNPNSGNVSKCEFEYGLTTAYGSKKACASLPGSGASAVGVSAALSGLSAGTTYHFRLVATNAGGTANGADQSFATAADTCATKASLCPPEEEEGKPQEKVGTASASPSAPVSGGKAQLKLSCFGGACKGTLKLSAKFKQGEKTKTLVIGSASYDLKDGESKTLAVALSGPAKQLLAQGKTIRATLGGGVKGTVALKPPKAKKRHHKRAGGVG